MISEAFLCVALSLPSVTSFAPMAKDWGIVWIAGSDQTPNVVREEKKLKDWLKKGGAEEVFIHPNPDRERLWEHGWEKVPFRWRDNDIWIRRKPNLQSRIETSA